MDVQGDPLSGLKSALGDLSLQVRAMEARREKERKLRRLNPVTGKLLPRGSRNRFIHDQAFIKEPLGRGDAELWITYSPQRERNLRMQEANLRMREEHPEMALIMDDLSGVIDTVLGGDLFSSDALNGYVAWPKRHGPRLPMGTGGLVQYIPVHGGVTYALKDSFATVWGFDTMHGGSMEVERTNPDWIRYECALLHHGLQIAEKLWPKFRREHDVSKRAEMAQALFEIEPAASGGLNDRLGFQAMLNLLTGRIG